MLLILLFLLAGTPVEGDGQVRVETACLPSLLAVAETVSEPAPSDTTPAAVWVDGEVVRFSLEAERGQTAALRLTLRLPRGTTVSLVPTGGELTLTVGTPAPAEAGVDRVTLLVDGRAAGFMAGDDAPALLVLTPPAGTPTITPVVEQAECWVSRPGDSTPQALPVRVGDPAQIPSADTTAGEGESAAGAVDSAENDSRPAESGSPSTESESSSAESGSPSTESGSSSAESGSPSTESGSRPTERETTPPVSLPGAVATVDPDGTYTATLFLTAATPSVPLVCLPLPPLQARPTPRPLTLHITPYENPAYFGPPNPRGSTQTYAAIYTGLSPGRAYAFCLYTGEGVTKLLFKDGDFFAVTTKNHLWGNGILT